MAISVTIGNQTYLVAETGERSWGSNTTELLEALANISGTIDGSKPNNLSDDAVFAGDFGIVVNYIKASVLAEEYIASAGFIRMKKDDYLAFRNNANDGDISVGLSALDRLQFNSVDIPTIDSVDTLTNKTIVAVDNVITTAASGNVTATELNAAIAELDTLITASDAALALHIADTTAHPAANITNVPAGNLVATDVQGALDELQAEVDPNTVHRSSDGKDHSDVVLNNTHRASDGTDHANVVLNDTHRASDGKDHSDVVLNNTHRGSDGSDHSKVLDNEAGISAVAIDLVTHASSINNPHSVTQDQVGLDQVDNTSDADKPISDDTQDALNLKANKLSDTLTTPTINGGTFTGIDGLGFDVYDDNSSGSIVSLVPTAPIVRLVNNSLTAFGSITIAPASKIRHCYITNDTTGDVTINNDETDNFVDSTCILTGTGANIDLASGASIEVVYDDTEERWRVVGGTGAGGLKVEFKTTNFTAEPNIHYVVSLSAAAVMTLPAISEGDVIKISDGNRNFGTYNLTINPNGADTIGGASQKILRDDKAALQLTAKTGDWVEDNNVVAGNGAIVSEWDDFIPSITNFAGTLSEAKKRRVGNNLELQVRYTNATANTGNIIFTIPDSLNTTLPTSFSNGYGYCGTNTTPSFINIHPISGGSTDQILFWSPEVAALVGAAGATMSGDEITFTISIPIAEWQGSGTTNLNADAIKRTKWLDITSYVSSDLTSAVTKYSPVRFTADSLGRWHAEGTVEFSAGSRSLADQAYIAITMPFTIANEDEYIPTIAGQLSSASVGLAASAFGILNSGDIRVYNVSGATHTVILCRATYSVLLESEPDWSALGTTASEALEKNPNVGVEEASADSAGLLKSYSESSDALTLVPSTWVLSTNNITVKCTKIGNRVFVDGRVIVSTGGNGYFRIVNSELPFSVVQGSVGGSFYRDNGSLIDTAIALVSSISSTEIQVRASALQTGTYSLNFNYRTTE
jgi:hypothetical protein